MIMVIMVHFSQKLPAPSRVLRIMATAGARAPQAFFLISTYLTWTSMHRNYKRPVEFYRSRFIRLAPIYYFALIVTLILDGAAQYSFPDILSHFVFLHGFSPWWINSLMGVAWYIGDLAIFYFLCPLLFKLVKDLRTSIIGFAVSAAISTACMLVFHCCFSETIAADSHLQAFCETFFFFHQFPGMFLGIVLFYLIERIKQTANLSRIRLLGILAIAVVAFLGLFLLLHLNKRVFTSSLAAGLVFGWILLFMYCTSFFWERKAFSIFAVMGKHSYGAYCIHMIFISLLVRVVGEIPMRLSTWLLFFTAILIASFGIGYVLEALQTACLRARKKDN